MKGLGAGLLVVLSGCPEASESDTVGPAGNGSAHVSSGEADDAGTAFTPPDQSAARPAPPPAPAFESDELPEPDLALSTIEEQREAMLRRMKAMGAASDAQVEAVRAIVFSNKRIGQGNPPVVEHPMTQKECMEKRRQAGVKDEKKPQCGAPFMVPIFDPSREKEADATTCIDRFEFPGLPCEYPMTWVTTNQAQELCKAVGKRLCDAHEWEGACAGAVLAPADDYAFGRPRNVMRGMHNIKREIVWAYGAEKDHKKCATGSKKSKKCPESAWKCGSNTYPTGAFPECRSKFGVYDLHGNAAEHMALPLSEAELGKKGGFGVPEMKGSWFIFQTIEAHEDDCRWRAPAWHDNEGKNHANYHLGFRCCKDVSPSAPK